MSDHDQANENADIESKSEATQSEINVPEAVLVKLLQDTNQKKVKWTSGDSEVWTKQNPDHNLMAVYECHYHGRRLRVSRGRRSADTFNPLSSIVRHAGTRTRLEVLSKGGFPAYCFPQSKLTLLLLNAAAESAEDIEGFFDAVLESGDL